MSPKYLSIGRDPGNLFGFWRVPRRYGYEYIYVYASTILCGTELYLKFVALLRCFLFIPSSYNTRIFAIYITFGVCPFCLGVILFRALYLGGWDIVKDYFDIEHASFFTRFVAAQVRLCFCFLFFVFIASVSNCLRCCSDLRTTFACASNTFFGNGLSSIFLY